MKELASELEQKKFQLIAKNKIHPLPNLLALSAIEDLLWMIDWLGQEALEDIRLTEEKIEAVRSATERVNLLEELAYRIGSRTLSYVNHLSVLNGICIKAFTDMNKLLREHNLPALTEDEEKKILESQATAFWPIKTFRDKIGAHTAYASPRNDTPFRTVNSLLNLKPHPGSNVLGNKVFMGGYDGDIPLVSIVTYKKDSKYFSDWFGHMCKAIELMENRMDHYRKIRIT